MYLCMSQNEARDCAILSNADLCGVNDKPVGFDVANRVRWYLWLKVKERFPHMSFTGWDMQTPEFRALQHAERAMVRIAREYWQTKGC